MLPRNAVLAALFALTLLIGGWRMADENSATNAGGSRLANLPRLTDNSRVTAKTSDWPSSLTNQLLAYARVIRDNQQLLLYAALAGFGTLMAALALSNATSAPKDTATQIMEILKQEKEKAEQLTKLKSEFLNQVSHELRTPLAVILGYLECMTDGLYGEIEAKHREILQTVAKQSSHLKNMIDQILIYSRLESSKQPLRIQEFSVQKLFSDL